jgi:protein-arginine kinase activator protein McsA
MSKCPKCKKDPAKPDKTWKYGQFMVHVFVCENCGTQFREYSRDGKHAFTSKVQKGKDYVKA